MAVIVRVVLVLLICWTRPCVSQSPIITLSSSSITLKPETVDNGTSVTVTCRPPSSGVKILVGLTIQRRSFDAPTSDATNIVSATVDLDNANAANAKLEVNMDGARAEGSMSVRSVSLVMSKASCSDEAIYLCEASFRATNGNIKSPISTAELKVEVDPGSLTMEATLFPTPPDPDVLKENTTLTLACSGPVGSVNTSGNTNDPKVSWVWQYRKNGISWSVYDGPDSDISTEGFSTVRCYKRQTSTLTRRLTLDDSKREYRCFVQRNFEEFDQFAARYMVATVTADGTVPDSDESSEPGTASVGAIVGGVFGALIVIAVIVIIIYFLVIRPRRRKQLEDNADSGPEKGDYPEAVSPGPEDPTVVYSQPTRRSKDKKEGVANKGMDESDDKHPPGDGKVPPDNDDKRHGRRSKNKKQPEGSYERGTAADEYDPDYDRLDPNIPHQRRDHRDDKPASYDRLRYRDDDGYVNDDDRRGRRHRDADNYREKQPPYDDDYKPGRRNRGYEHDNRARGRHSSSEDGGNDSYVNTSQYSMGDGDPTIGTAI